MTDFDRAADAVIRASQKLREERLAYETAFIRYRNTSASTDRQAEAQATAETGALVTEAEANYEIALARLRGTEVTHANQSPRTAPLPN